MDKIPIRWRMQTVHRGGPMIEPGSGIPSGAGKRIKQQRRKRRNVQSEKGGKKRLKRLHILMYMGLNN